MALVPAAMISRDLLTTNAETQVIQNARIMMETAMAMRGYTVGQLRPLLAPLMADEFLPQSVPAYSATEIFNALRENHPEYTYKEATLNPTDPRNRAVDWETDIINEFRRDENRTEIVGHRGTPLGPALYLSKPIKVGNESCLACHTTPEIAPQTMLAVYGTEGGFGWQMNEIIGAQIVQVPMSEPVRLAEVAFRKLLLVLNLAPDVIAAITGHLTDCIGPVARVLVKREVSAGGDLNDVALRLAEQIPDAEERQG